MEHWKVLAQLWFRKSEAENDISYKEHCIQVPSQFMKRVSFSILENKKMLEKNATLNGKKKTLPVFSL